MHIFFDARTIDASTKGLSLYARSLFEVFVTLLEETDTITILVRETAFIPPDHSHPQVEYLKTIHPARSLKGRRELLRAAALHHPNLYWSPDPLIPVNGLRPRRILTLHDLAAHARPELLTLRERLRWRWVGDPQIRRASRVICPTHVLRHACAAAFGNAVAKRSTVIYNGVHESFRPCSEAEVRPVRQRLLLPKKYFLFIGQDTPWRNFDTLLNALAAGDDSTAIPLIVAGAGSDTPARRKRVAELQLQDIVRFIGPVDDPDLPLLYSGAYATLHPATVEGFSQTILQSLACGTPVICSALPENQELFGNAVMQVHPTDRIEWQNALITLAVSAVLRDRLREQGLKRALDFTWRRTARQSLDLCRALCGEKTIT